MAAPLNPAHLDHAIELYLASKPQSQILTATGISATTLHRERSRRGIPPRREHALPVEDITAAYLAGESEYSLSLRYRVTRTAIRKRLIDNGAQIRNRSAAGEQRAAAMTSDQRSRQATAAHAAVRGTKQPLDLLVRRAFTRQASSRIDSAGEQILHDMLTHHGLAPVAQQAIGKYNVDLAVAPVAVEVLGGGWHAYKRHHAVRTPEILDAGWHLVFVWNHEGDSALRAGAANYVVTFLEQVRRQPPSVGQYRVISGSGQPLSAGSADDDEFPLVPPPRGRRSRRT